MSFLPRFTATVEGARPTREVTSLVLRGAKIARVFYPSLHVRYPLSAGLQPKDYDDITFCWLCHSLCCSLVCLGRGNHIVCIPRQSRPRLNGPTTDGPHARWRCPGRRVRHPTASLYRLVSSSVRTCYLDEHLCTGRSNAPQQWVCCCLREAEHRAGRSFTATRIFVWRQMVTSSWLYVGYT